MLVWSLPIIASASDPQTIYVVEASAHARSGPSLTDYRTDPLSHGQQLTAYGETADGWMAVQPPPGSFDWITDDSMELQPGGQTGVITKEKTQAWIGTHLGRARKFGYQVLLAKDEVVTVLGKAQLEGEGGPQTWYKIVPPSGEFRFIHRDEIVHSSEELIERVKSIEKRNIAQAESLTPAPVQDLASKNRSSTESDLAKNSKPRIDQVSAVDQGEQRLGHSVLADASESASESTTSSRNRDRRRRANPKLDVASDEELSQGRGLLSMLGVARLKKTMASNPDSANQNSFGIAAIGSGVDTPWSDAGRNENRTAKAQRTREDFPSDDDATVGQTQMLSGISAMPPQTLTPLTSIASLSAPRVQPPTQTRPPLGSGNDFRARGSGSLTADPFAARQNSGSATIAPVAPVGYQTELSNLPNSPSFSTSSFSTSSIAVSQTRLDSLAEQVDRADAVGLQMMLSELMTRKSTSLETEVLVNRLRRDVAEGAISPSLLERGQRYLELSRRRESSAPTIIDDRVINFEQPPQQNDAAVAIDQADVVATEDQFNGEVSISGQLLKVYSARPGAPPFSLTDAGGQTLCYITPMPGVNVRNYVNSQIEVVGVREQLAGLSTVNIRVSSVVVR